MKILFIKYQVHDFNRLYIRLHSIFMDIFVIYKNHHLHQGKSLAQVPAWKTFAPFIANEMMDGARL